MRDMHREVMALLRSGSSLDSVLLQGVRTEPLLITENPDDLVPADVEPDDWMNWTVRDGKDKGKIRETN